MSNHKVPGFQVNRILACPAGWYAGTKDEEGWMWEAVAAWAVDDSEGVALPMVNEAGVITLCDWHMDLIFNQGGKFNDAGEPE